MSLLLLLAVASAGGVGAALRYVADHSLPAQLKQSFPWGTAVVNLSGSFALGWLTGAAASWVSDEWIVVLGTGLLGGYTTFSTASFETVRLLRDGQRRSAALYGIGVLVGCVALATLGLAIAAG